MYCWASLSPVGIVSVSVASRTGRCGLALRCRGGGRPGSGDGPSRSVARRIRAAIGGASTGRRGRWRWRRCWRGARCRPAWRSPAPGLDGGASRVVSDGRVRLGCRRRLCCARPRSSPQSIQDCSPRRGVGCLRRLRVGCTAPRGGGLVFDGVVVLGVFEGFEPVVEGVEACGEAADHIGEGVDLGLQVSQCAVGVGLAKAGGSDALVLGHGFPSSSATVGVLPSCGAVGRG
ncbi:hypothetical protein SAMN04487904_101556 [Actinopolyspora lacussalsi subsp. righensis]|uniref:Uncharacterized protein n=1 Tax=Actinopolyspora righensis TaxID=995060 RepID=A0A1I6XFP5_9ACTN|nr:hypothetical protein SAMN04487904_101556 [Actinopolyspora righensis]